MFCSGTGLLSERDGDLEFLRAFDVRPTVGMTYGLVPLPEQSASLVAQIAREAVLAVTGPVDRTIAIDAKGRSEIAGLPSGDYLLEVRSGALDPIEIESVNRNGAGAVVLPEKGWIIRE